MKEKVVLEKDELEEGKIKYLMKTIWTKKKIGKIINFENWKNKNLKEENLERNWKWTERKILRKIQNNGENNKNKFNNLDENGFNKNSENLEKNLTAAEEKIKKNTFEWLFFAKNSEEFNKEKCKNLKTKFEEISCR